MRAALRLGLVATREEAAADAVGLLAAALLRGWACRCFLTDRGVRLLLDPAFRDLIGRPDLRLDVCEHSWARFGDGGPGPEGIMGGQYQNAELAHTSDRVIVL